MCNEDINKYQPPALKEKEERKICMDLYASSPPNLRN